MGVPKHARIVAMTAAAAESDRAKWLAAGMDDYITKPVQPGALASALVNWGARPVPKPAPEAGLVGEAERT